MKIATLTIRKINIPFKVNFKHSLADRSEVESILLEIELESGQIGYGECVPRDYVTGETTDSVFAALQDHVCPALKGHTFKSYQDLHAWLDEFSQTFSDLPPNSLCVKTATELALLDAIGKYEKTSVAKLVGGLKKGKLKYSAIISADTPEKVKKLLWKYKLVGFSEVKIKVGTDQAEDMERVRLARKILGSRANIRIDANAEWSLEDSKRLLPEYYKYGITSVEQPMPVSAKEDYPALNAFLGGKIHVCIDESLCSYEDGLWMAKNKGAGLFNLRVSKNGGITNALKLYKMGQEHGIHSQLGAQVGETSILSAAGQILAGTAGNFLFHEGSFGLHLLRSDIMEKPVVFGFRGMTKPSQLDKGHGLGILVDPKRVEELSIQVKTI